MDGNDITPRGLAHLTLSLNFTKLATLDLSNNRLGGQGYEMLIHALPGNTEAGLPKSGLHHLNVSRNGIPSARKTMIPNELYSDVDMHAFALALELTVIKGEPDERALLPNSALRSLNLSHNKLKTVGPLVSGVVRSKIVRLDLGNNLISNHSTRILARFMKRPGPHLKEVELGGNKLRFDTPPTSPQKGRKRKSPKHTTPPISKRRATTSVLKRRTSSSPNKRKTGASPPPPDLSVLLQAMEHTPLETVGLGALDVAQVQRVAGPKLLRLLGVETNVSDTDSDDSDSGRYPARNVCDGPMDSEDEEI